MIEIDHKKRGLDPQVPGLQAKWLANEVVRVMCKFVQLSHEGHMILGSLYVLQGRVVAIQQGF